MASSNQVGWKCPVIPKYLTIPSDLAFPWLYGTIRTKDLVRLFPTLNIMQLP
jgi:hypothetical protein